VTEQNESLTPRTPFDPESTASVSGLGQPALLGCGGGCLVLLMLTFLLVGVATAKREEVERMMTRAYEWMWLLSFERFESQLEESSPVDWSEADGRELREAFDAAAQTLAHMGSGIDVGLVARMNSEIWNCTRKIQRNELTSKDLEALRSSLEAVAVAAGSRARGNVVEVGRSQPWAWAWT